MAYSTLHATTARFCGSTSGNFAMLTAVLMVPMLLSAGLALDAAAISNAQNRLQAATDAAALAVAREGETLSGDRANAIAVNFMSENYPIDYSDLVVTRTGTRVDLSAKSAPQLAFAGLLGFDTWTVSATSSADIAYSIYEIALVLDTTGSMKGGKLTAMKDAVEGLIDGLSSQVTGTDRLKFALVPFSSFVNVGPQHGPSFFADGTQRNDGATWLDLNGSADIPQVDLQPGVSRFRVANHLGRKWTGCVETRVPVGSASDTQHDVLDTRPDASRPATLFVPAFAPDEPDSGFLNSYIRNESDDLDPLDRSPDNLKRKLKKYGIPFKPDGTPDPASDWTSPNASMSGEGPNAGCYSRPITPLTNNFARLRSEVSALEANGNTNILEGVAWGMRVLSPEAPFTEGRSREDFGVEKIMIVLTDGSNVFGNTGNALGSRYSSFGYLADGRLGISSGSSSQTNEIMNEKTIQACSAAKEGGMVVYTIRLEEPDVTTGMMLKECATSAGHFFDAPSRTQLDEVFRTIADRIVRIRISA